MKITFLGAAKTVTGSCYLVETAQTSFLVDCGMFQGNARETMRNALPLRFDIGSIDFMLLTHAHIDHSGRIPKLWLDGYRGDIFATKATADLCGIMLADSGHIQETETEWQNRKNMRSGKPEELPLYTMEDAVQACKLLRATKYDETFNPAPDVKVRFRDAGHILGSSILELWITEGAIEKKLVFSGDLGNKNQPIIRDPAIIDSADVLVMESTYGDRLHMDKVDKVERFFQIIDQTIARGGNVVIPSFAVGRTQEIIYELNLKQEKYKDRLPMLKSIPVYVDSPLAISATQVFRQNIDCFDEEARAYIANGDNPLDFPNLHFTATLEESKAINFDPESKIIISASGMCDAGRIKHHLKHNLWRADSTILFVGYQAVGTLGRQLVDGAKRVRLFGEEIKVNAKIESIEGFSGHADQAGLLDWVNAMQQKPASIILTHGEGDAIVKFAEVIQTKFGIKAMIPEMNESIAIGTEPIVRAVPQPQTPVTNEGVIKLVEALQEEFNLTMDGIKAAYKPASPQEMEAVHAANKAKLKQSADDVLKRFNNVLENLKAVGK